MDDTFRLVKLSQASEVAKVISNKTAQTIIEFIGSKKKATASQIAKNLKLPASTVHYNMKALVKGEIVDDSQFTYSSKGKTIIHYSLTNNILVIVPESRDKFSLLNSMKALVPSLLGVGVLGAIYAWIQSSRIVAGSSSFQLKNIPQESGAVAADTIQEEAMMAASEPVPGLLAQTTSSSSSQPDFLLGLLVASILIVFIFLIYSFLRSRKNKK